jgi:hypothetical protein
VSGWTTRTALLCAAALSLPGAAAALPSGLPGTVPPAPARGVLPEAAEPDPASADLTVSGGLRTLLTVTLPRELAATDTSGCRRAASSLTPEGATVITCRWKGIDPVDHRTARLELQAARLRQSDAALAHPEVVLRVESETPDPVEEDNRDAFRVRIQPLLPDPREAPPPEAGPSAEAAR